MVKIDSHERPSSEECLAHPWFQNAALTHEVQGMITAAHAQRQAPVQNRPDQPNSQTRMSSSTIKQVNDDTWNEKDASVRRLNPSMDKSQRQKFPRMLFSSSKVTKVFLGMLGYAEEKDG